MHYDRDQYDLSFFHIRGGKESVADAVTAGVGGSFYQQQDPSTSDHNGNPAAHVFCRAGCSGKESFGTKHPCPGGSAAVCSVYFGTWNDAEYYVPETGLGQ